MDLKQQVLQLLGSVLDLRGRAEKFDLDTPLLGALPELDSIAVVSLLTAMEETFGISVEDDDVDGRTFATVGSLVEFIRAKTTA